jgi:hypothetical protein
MKRSGFKQKATVPLKRTPLARISPLKASKRPLGASKPKKTIKTTRAKKMGQKRALLEKYGLPQIPCSRWGTAKKPTNTDLLKGMLWTVFSKYIRERDKEMTCITCGNPLAGDVQAGHYIPVGDSSVTMWFREDNVHGEHANCNANWNDWHLVPMRKNMVRLYSEEHISQMDSYAGRKDSVKLEEIWYVDKIKYYYELS